MEGMHGLRPSRTRAVHWYRQILRSENIVKWVTADGTWYDVMLLNIPFDTKAAKIVWLMWHYSQETSFFFQWTVRVSWTILWHHLNNMLVWRICLAINVFMPNSKILFTCRTWPDKTWPDVYNLDWIIPSLGHIIGFNFKLSKRAALFLLKLHNTHFIPLLNV